MWPASLCKSDGFNNPSVGFKSTSIQYTLPVRLRSARPGSNPNAVRLGHPGLRTLLLAEQPQRNHRRIAGARHFQRIIDAPPPSVWPAT
jgi:hypothetical protein